MMQGKRVGKARFLRNSRVAYAGIAVLILLLNMAAWNSNAFSDWYIAHIFPIWVGTYGRVTGLVPFSVGEWLIVAGLALVTLVLVSGALWLLIGLAAVVRRVHGRVAASRKASGPDIPDCLSGFSSVPDRGEGDCGRAAVWLGRYRKFSRGLYRFFSWTLLFVCLIMTLNCFILYHASTFSEHYFGEDDGTYSLEELMSVYNMAVRQCNQLAFAMERDETGMVVYLGSLGEEGELLDMADMARELMGQLGKTYSQLDGYYPRPKALRSSDFMCQQHMQGYYFPFSMEANYNDVMHILNIPSTMCHELAHLRGYIYEDEANFIGYLACVESEDAFFQYAGYLSVLNYLSNDLYRAKREEEDLYEEAVAAVGIEEVDSQVWTDNIFVAQEEWDRINGKALIDTEIVDRAADVFIDTNLKVNGISDGAVSYSRVVRLLLQYYRQHPVLEIF